MGGWWEKETQETQDFMKEDFKAQLVNKAGTSMPSNQSITLPNRECCGCEEAGDDPPRAQPPPATGHVLRHQHKGGYAAS